MDTIKSFVSENYEIVNTTTRRDRPVRIFKAKNMLPLPSPVLEKVTRHCESVSLVRGPLYRNFAFDNLDYGFFDMSVLYHARRDRGRDRLDVFICSVLIRPFSPSAEKYYVANCFPLSPLARLRVRFDSRVYDKDLFSQK